MLEDFSVMGKRAKPAAAVVGDAGPFRVEAQRYWDGKQWASRFSESGEESGDPARLTLQRFDVSAPDGGTEQIYTMGSRENVVLGGVAACFMLLCGAGLLPVAIHQGGVNGVWLSALCLLLIAVSPYGAWRTWILMRHPTRVCVTERGLTAYNNTRSIVRADAREIASIELTTMRYSPSRVAMSTPLVTRKDGSTFCLDGVAARRSAGSTTIQCQEAMLWTIRATLKVAGKPG